LRKLAKILQLRAEFWIAAIGANQVEEALRLLAALDLKDLRTVGVEQVCRRLDPVDPARCIHIRISHDTVLKIMRVRKQLGTRVSGFSRTRIVATVRCQINIVARTRQMILKNETKANI
jgi:hypothetical protein